MEPGHTIPILGKGYVRYIDHLGSDLRIVESARISYKSPSKGVDQEQSMPLVRKYNQQDYTI